MIRAIPCILLAGLASFALILVFLALVPRFAAADKSGTGALIQWCLILALVIPAIFVSALGPLWLFEVTADGPTTREHRFWLLVCGAVLLAVSFLGAALSPVGRRYSVWRSRVG